MRKVGWYFLAFLAMGLFVAGAFAQTTGSIEGVVVDENNAPLPGVTVEATSPGLQGTKVSVTDAAEGESILPWSALGEVRPFFECGNKHFALELDVASPEEGAYSLGVVRSLRLKLFRGPSFLVGEWVVSVFASIRGEGSTRDGKRFKVSQWNFANQMPRSFYRKGSSKLWLRLPIRVELENAKGYGLLLLEGEVADGDVNWSGARFALDPMLENEGLSLASEMFRARRPSVRAAKNERACCQGAWCASCTDACSAGGCSYVCEVCFPEACGDDCTAGMPDCCFGR
ncbi:MAG: carboxypeptidase-like regulatory domain-containing protein [Thermoanaerobaculum sp.]